MLAPSSFPAWKIIERRRGIIVQHSPALVLLHDFKDDSNASSISLVEYRGPNEKIWIYSTVLPHATLFFFSLFSKNHLGTNRPPQLGVPVCLRSNNQQHTTIIHHATVPRQPREPAVWEVLSPGSRSRLPREPPTATKPNTVSWSAYPKWDFWCAYAHQNLCLLSTCCAPCISSSPILSKAKDLVT